MPKRRRKVWWIVAAVFVLGILAATFLTPRVQTNIHGYAFLSRASYSRNEDSVVVQSGHKVGTGPTKTLQRLHVEYYQSPMGADQVFDDAAKEMQGKRLRMVLQSGTEEPRRRVFTIEKKGGIVIVEFKETAKKTTDIMVVDYSDPTLIDRAVAWVKKLFGR